MAILEYLPATASVDAFSRILTLLSRPAAMRFSAVTPAGRFSNENRIGALKPSARLIPTVNSAAPPFTRLIVVAERELGFFRHGQRRLADGGVRCAFAAAARNLHGLPSCVCSRSCDCHLRVRSRRYLAALQADLAVLRSGGNFQRLGGDSFRESGH